MRRSLRQAQQRGSEAPNASPNKHSETNEREVPALSHNSQAPRKRPARAPQTRRDASHDEDDDYQSSDRESSNKKRKIVSRSKNGQKLGNSQLFQRLFNIDGVVSDRSPCQPPQRIHNIDYHRPLLLDSRKGRTELLEWFDNVSSRRSMPWRKPWVDPRMDVDGPALREKLERRAYEVWISEIMLQQTRVAVVIDYWNRWMEKWPTIHELAAASGDDVLAAWRGLGYYSRATRIHDAAKLVCEDLAMKGLLPSSVDTLVAKVPGVGRYTAGAISAIVFGKAAPMVDGNVLRVLSRQLGLLGDVKRDKPAIDLLWAAADSLVKAVAESSCEECSCDEKISSATGEQISDRPGRWGQALMELGSTVCTPKPDCEACPISTSCRAYGEGLQLASTRGLAPKDMKTDLNTKPLPDIEESCDFCKPFEEVALNGDEGDAEIVPLSKKTSASRSKARPRIRRQATLSAFFAQSSESKETTDSVPDKLTPAGVATIVDHARKFPVKVVKKAVKEQETLVCAIRRSDGCYVIHRRPQKGLLAGLWEFPSWIVPEDHENMATSYQRAAELHASAVLDPTLKSKSLTHPKLKYVGKLGSVPWLFSHLKLTMHVFLFEIRCSQNEYDTLPSTDDRWSGSIEAESMGTGMRKCWDLVREVNGD
ncbi:A/G-specific adenine glycosylase [Xylaria grammica]|nr:A/G-specific adenine glycosylase [Xylaria grammica]